MIARLLGPVTTASPAGSRIPRTALRATPAEFATCTFPAVSDNVHCKVSALKAVVDVAHSSAAALVNWRIIEFISVTPVPVVGAQNNRGGTPNRHQKW